MIVPGSANALLLRSARGYQINQSLRFRASNSAFLSWTRIGGTSAADTSTLIKTYNVKLKRGTLGANGVFLSNWLDASNFWQIAFNASDQIEIRQTGISVAPGVTAGLANTTAVFRDPSAWYDINIRIDTTQATGADRFRVQVNGVDQTLTYSTTPVQNTVVCSFFTPGSGTYTVRWGQRADAGVSFDGYLAEVRAIDGQSLAATSFGQFDPSTNSWVPRRYTGTYGTNGFYLPFNDATSTVTISQDRSGNGNNWTSSGISVTAGATFDQMLDSPTNNYAVMWPNTGAGTGFVSRLNSTAANLNLDTTSGSWFGSPGTFGVSSGKWYWEVTVTNLAGQSMIGVANASMDTAENFAAPTRSWTYYNTGTKYGGGTNAAYGASYTTNDVIGVELDMDAGTIAFRKNNVSQGTAFTGLVGPLFPWVSLFTSGTAVAVNFGQRPFAYTPPTGFVALNTQNLSTPTITNGYTGFNAVLRTGTGAAASVSSLLFQPDLVWIKSRSNATNHNLFDAVRGVNNGLVSNSTAAEYADANSLTAFSSNGYTLGSDAGSRGVNINTNTYVDWAWREGAAYGFDIVLDSGTSANKDVAHALNAVPHMMIRKCRNVARSWRVYHRNANASPATGSLILDTTAAFTVDATDWNNTVPGSSTFRVGTGYNVTGENYVTYLWTSIPGFSLFGSYTGNGSADGPFVWCGFRPRFVMIKGATFASNWNILDAARDPSNVADELVRANLADAEFNAIALSSGFAADFTANGFKLRGGLVDSVSNGQTFIFAAFAETPFKTATAR